MYSPKAKKVYIRLYEAAQEKLASAYGVLLQKQPANQQKGKQNATPSQR
jgi:hypothetical protein